MTNPPAKRPGEEEGNIMQLIDNLYNHFQARAEATKVTNLTVGLGYTAVSTDDGGMGIAYTYVDKRHCCSMNKDYRDY